MKLKKELVLRRAGNGYFIVEPDKGIVDMTRVYTMNETSAWLWNELSGRHFTVPDMVNLLVSRYNVSPEQAENDANHLIANWKKYNLVVDSDDKR